MFIAPAAAGEPPAKILIGSTHMKAHRLAGGGNGGALLQAIGISQGDRNCELHALTDGEGRKLRFVLIGGNIADRRAANILLDDLAPYTIVLADKAHDTDAMRDLIQHLGAVQDIPSTPDRRWKS